MNFKLYILSLFVFFFHLTNAQKLQPGFDKQEYIDLMKLSAQIDDSAYRAAFPTSPRFHLSYRSPVMGLDNRWDLWTTGEGLGIISVRGTTKNAVSWLGNFYAAMVPAKGALKLSDKETFTYELSSHPKAAVHVGWLLSTAYLAKDMLPKIDSCYKNGIKDIVIMGHSQGGAIVFLLTAYLYSLQLQGSLPADIRFKTYCSAGPKPGNLYFAYEYERLTQGGWAYNVVNSADWVPETPLSLQTVNDFNTVNPFANAKPFIKKQKGLKRWALSYAYGRLDKPARRAVKNYQKYLGTYVFKTVKKVLPEFSAPEYYNSNHYVRTGNTIVLLADDAYFKLYPQNKDSIFINHFHAPYLYLANKLPMHLPSHQNVENNTALNGTWELNYISGRKIAFNGLYPDKKPTISFDVTNNKFSGNTSCNSFTGILNTEHNQISFTNPFALTKMMCPGEGEQSFIEVLKTVNAYTISGGNTLNFMMGDIAVMRFVRK